MKGNFTKEDSALFESLELKKAPVQAQMNELKATIQAATSTNKTVIESRAKIFEIQKELVPFAEMQAALASSTSRDKYFPDLNKNNLIQYIKDSLK
jgi:hypothetical protein